MRKTVFRNVEACFQILLSRLKKEKILDSLGRKIEAGRILSLRGIGGQIEHFLDLLCRGFLLADGQHKRVDFSSINLELKKAILQK